MATLTKIETMLPNGKIFVNYQYEGILFPEFFVEEMPNGDLLKQMNSIKNAEIRDDDVLLIAYSKAGTHWTWEIQHMIQNGKAEYHGYTKVGAMLELTSPEMIAKLSLPRVLNTHLPPHLHPTGILKKRCKIVHVMRNPKDIVISSYFHQSNRLEAFDRKYQIAPLDHFLKTFRGIDGCPPLCTYPLFIRQIENFRADNPGHPVMNVFYEDLKQDPEGQIRKIAQFLDKKLDDATVTEISQKCNFSNLKAAHDGKDDILAKVTKGDGAFIYRKGIVGDWKNHFTVAQSEEFDKWLDEEMKDLPIKFRFE